MTHDEVFTFFKAMCPQMATKEVLCWYPCGYNTIRLVMAKDKREFCFTVGDSSTRDYHMRLYSEWLKEEFPEDPDTICGMSKREYMLKKIDAAPSNLTRLEVRDEDTHEYDQVGPSYFWEYAEKHPDYEIAEVAVIANKTVYRCRPKQ